MLQGVNIFDFFYNLEDRRWDNADIKEYCVIFQNSIIPGFIVVLQTAETTASLDFIDAITDEVIQNYSINTIYDSDITGYKIILFVETTKTGVDDGYYYYKITIGSSIYYSEVFEWRTNLSNLIKFDIFSENTTMGEGHNMPFSDLHNIFYLQTNGVSLTPDITEKGSEKPYGDIPVFSTVNYLRTLNINGNDQILTYLAAIRIFEVNGIIKITIKGKEKLVYDTKCEILEDDTFGDTIILNFLYKEIDYLSVRNAI
jgi:hypothetical protein